MKYNSIQNVLQPIFSEYNKISFFFYSKGLLNLIYY